MEQCLTQELIERYVENTCSGKEQEHIRVHLSQCGMCRQSIDHATRTIATDMGALTSASVSDERTMVSHAYDIATQGISDDATSERTPPQSDPTQDLQAVSGLFDDYKILKELPRGAQAVVYKAIHLPTKKKVALKMLLPMMCNSAKARAYFEREVELAASLNHPNLITVYDTGITRGQYYFSMEYIRGACLDEHVRSNNLTMRQTVELFLKVCDGVACAHQHGIIHRDLKPSNILVDTRDEPRVLDFGLAKTTGPSEAESLVSVTGEIKGTINYMSPEQADGRSDLLDVRGDVYTLGVILYRLLTGKLPYDLSGPTVKALTTIVNAEPTRLRLVIKHFNSELEAILMKALAKDREQRYQSAAELKRDLDCWLKGLPVMARSLSAGYLLKKIIGRHRVAASILALLVVIVLSFAYTSFTLYLDAEKARKESESIKTEWSQQFGKDFRYDKEMILARLITFWQADDTVLLEYGARFLGNASDEKKALIFLNDGIVTKTSIANFRNSLSEQKKWLADYCLAEYSLKQGDRDRALDLFQTCYQNQLKTNALSLSKMKPTTLVQLKARLFELSGDRSE
jgi:serine/threonine protein kinase